MVHALRRRGDVRGLGTDVKTAAALRDEGSVQIVGHNELLCDRSLNPCVKP
jgi:cyanophycinase-like exopeptidase